MTRRDEFDVCVIGTGAGGGVEAKQLKFHSQLSGSFASTAIDTDETGSKAVFTTLEGVGSLGRITAQGVGNGPTCLTQSPIRMAMLLRRRL